MTFTPNILRLLGCQPLGQGLGMRGACNFNRAARISNQDQDSREQRITDAFSNDIAAASVSFHGNWKCEFEELQKTSHCAPRLCHSSRLNSSANSFMYIRLTLPCRAPNSLANQTAQLRIALESSGSGPCGQPGQRISVPGATVSAGT